VIRALGVAVLVAGCADDGGPRLDAVTPAAAGRGATVTLSGRRLCGTHADCTTAAGEVLIGLELPAIQAIVTMYGDTSAQIMIPQVAPIGSTHLVVTAKSHATYAKQPKLVTLHVNAALDQYSTTTTTT